MTNITATCATQAMALDLAARLSELSDGLTACVQQNANASDLLEVLENTVEDLCDYSAKYTMKAQELRYSDSIKEKSDNTKFLEATKLLFRSPAVDKLIHACRVFKKAEAENIIEAVSELDNRAVVVAYACNEALERAKKIAVVGGMEF